jgi:hypothetical protein
MGLFMGFIVKKIEFVGISKPLTNWQKEKIVSALLEKRFRKQEDKIAVRKTGFADELYIEFVEPFRKYFELCPGRFSHETEWISFRTGNQWGDRYNLKMPAKRIIGHTNGDYKDTPALTAKDYPEFNKKMEKIDQDEKKLTEKKKQVKAQIQGALKHVKSTKKLFTEWPEGYKVFIECCPQKEVYLPAIPREDLNKELGL